MIRVGRRCYDSLRLACITSSPPSTRADPSGMTPEVRLVTRNTTPSDERTRRFRRVQVRVCVVCLLVVVGNELCQRFAARGLIDHRWVYGYLSDLFAVPFATTLTTAMVGPRSRNRALPILFAIMYSLLELEGVRDPLDVACYWAGAAIAFAAIHVGGR